MVVVVSVELSCGRTVTSYRWDELDKVGSFDAAHEAGGEDADGNPTHTITLTQSEAAGKPLTRSLTVIASPGV